MPNKIWVLIYVLWLSDCVINCQDGQSPCPNVFQYRMDGGQVYGSIELPPTTPVNVIALVANFTISTRLLTSYIGRIEPVGPELQLLQEYNRGRSIGYRVHFPITSPLPRLTSIVVNGNVICYGPGDTVVPGVYVTTITLQHTLYLKSGSLSQPVNTNMNNNWPQPSAPNSVSNFQGSVADMGDSILYTFGDNDFTDDRNGIIWNAGGQDFFGNKSRPIFETTVHQSPPVYQDHYPSIQNVQPAPVKPQPEQPYYPSVQHVQPAPVKPQPVQPISQLPSLPPSPPPTVPPSPPPAVPPPPPPTVPPTESPRPPPPAPPLPPAPPQEGPIQCGTIANERVPLIFNGYSISRGDWPWMVAIYKRKDGGLIFICSGTLVSDRHVVSAAHCVHQKSSRTPTRDLVVKVGVFNLQDWGDDITVTRTLNTANIHQAFNPKTLANDILVITLERSVTFTNFIRPACLWTGNTEQSRIVGASGVVVGWGDNELGPGGHGEPRIVRMPVVSISACRASRPDFHKLTSSNTLCAGDRNGAGPCLGDSGGGLYLLEDGRWRLRGVVSLSLRADNGDNTCNLNEYIVFTDTAQYLPWITSAMN